MHKLLIKKNNLSSECGFTLIELMIVVAIIAIISAIALPSYFESVARSRRADAQSTLQESAQWLERYYSQNNNYTGSGTALFNSGYQYSPKGSTSGNAQYVLTIVANAQDYTLMATPTNGMSSDPCGVFVLNSVGQKTQQSNTRSDCWAH